MKKVAKSKKTAKIGLSEFKYAQLKEEGALTIEDIQEIPGLQSAKQTVSTEQTIVFADDGPYLVLDSGITELKLELGLVDINTEHKGGLLGVTIEKGMEIYKKDITAPYVACSYKSKLDGGKYVHFGLVKGKFGLPSSDLKSIDGKIEAQTDTIEGNFVDDNGGVMYVIGREDHPDFKYSEFMKLVYGVTIPTTSKTQSK